MASEPSSSGQKHRGIGPAIRYVWIMDIRLLLLTYSLGGSLSLLGHNIHVFPGSSLRVDRVRDGYTTRRRAEIELATFARTREGYVKISCAEAAFGDCCP